MTDSKQKKGISWILGWDITLREEDWTCKEVMNLFIKIANCWTFQGEIGFKTGFRHWQCRIRAIKRMSSKSSFLKFLCELTKRDKKDFYDVSQTTTAVFSKENFDYVLKAENKDGTINEVFDGPYTDKDIDTVETNNWTPPYLEEFHDNLLPFQKEIVDKIKTHIDFIRRKRKNQSLPEDKAYYMKIRREINYIIDFRGNRGKSILALIGELMYGCIDIPPMDDFQKLIQHICCKLMQKKERYPNGFFLDFPRTLKKDKLLGYFGAIEMLNNGKCYDPRNTANDYHFCPAPIIVCSNEIPDFTYLTKNRWNVYLINENNELINYTNNIFDLYREEKKYYMDYKIDNSTDPYKMTPNEIREYINRIDNKIDFGLDDDLTSTNYS